MISQRREQDDTAGAVCLCACCTHCAAQGGWLCVCVHAYTELRCVGMLLGTSAQLHCPLAL